MDLLNFIPGYQQIIFDSGREPAFIVFLSFIVTYILTRGYTRLAKVRGWGSAHFGGVHTHHMVFGLVIAFASGGLLFGFMPEQGPLLSILACAFGSGAALVLDEFALIFHLQDVYWEKEGRKSIDTVVLGAAFCGLFLLRFSPLNINTKDSLASIAIYVTFNISCIVIAALKGKVYLAVFGVFIPSISQIGAIRLAEPGSIWARKFYTNKPKKLKKSIGRYERYERKWRQRKESAWNFIGGKTGR